MRNGYASHCNKKIRPLNLDASFDHISGPSWLAQLADCETVNFKAVSSIPTLSDWCLLPLDTVDKRLRWWIANHSLYECESLNFSSVIYYDRYCCWCIYWIHCPSCHPFCSFQWCIASFSSCRIQMCRMCNRRGSRTQSTSSPSHLPLHLPEVASKQLRMALLPNMPMQLSNDLKWP